MKITCHSDRSPSASEGAVEEPAVHYSAAKALPFPKGPAQPWKSGASAPRKA